MNGGDGSSGGDGAGGGGGRIAVYVTSGTDFDAVAMQAYGGLYGTVIGGAGTVYRQTSVQAAGAGTVTLDNGGRTGAAYTYLMPEANSVPDELRRAAVVVTNQAKMRLPGITTVGNIYVYTNSSLTLTNFNLFVDSTRHELGGGTLSATTGRIVWKQGAVFIVR